MCIVRVVCVYCVCVCMCVMCVCDVCDVCVHLCVHVTHQHTWAHWSHGSTWLLLAMSRGRGGPGTYPRWVCPHTQAVSTTLQYVWPLLSQELWFPNSL